MRTIISALFSVVAAGHAFQLNAQIYVGPASSLYVPAGAMFQVDSLTLQPSMVMRLSNNSIHRRSTPEWAPGAGNATILQVYEIDTPLNFSGTASITYADGSLNGNSAASLNLLRAAELADTLRFAAGGLNNLTSRTVSAAFGNLQRFAKFSAASTASPLLLEVISFDARKDAGTRARLDWNVAKAAPGDLFILERSGNGRQFAFLAEVPVRAPSGAFDVYTEFDEAPLPGLNIYRLATVDAAGRLRYHSTRSLVFGDHGLSILAWPVPADEVLHVAFGRKPAVDCRLLLMDAAGRIVGNVAAQDQQVDMRLNGLSAGVYLLRSTESGNVETLRIIKQ